MNKRPDSRTWLYLLAIVVLAAALRLVGIGSTPLWGDEGLTIVIAEWSVRDMILLPTDPTPFLYYALHKALFSADDSAALMRSISWVSGVASVPLIYVLGRVCFDARTGLIAALLLAVSTIHVGYSIEARAYALMMLFSLGMSIGLVKYALLADGGGSGGSERRLHLAIFALCSVLSFYTHLTAVFWIAATNLILLAVLVRQRGTHVAEVAVAWTAMLVLAAPGLYRLLLQFQGGDSFGWLEQANIARVISNLAEVYLPSGLWNNDVVRARGLINAVKAGTILLAILLLAALVYAARGRAAALLRAGPVTLLLAAYLAVPVLIWLFGYIARPVFMDRAVMFCLPGLLLIVAALIADLSRAKAGIVTSALALVFIASGAVQGFTNAKPAWDEAASFLVANVRPGDVMLVCPDYAYPALRHALQGRVAAPMLTMTGETQFLVLEPAFGTDENWSRTFYERSVVPAYQRVFGPETAQASRQDDPTVFQAGGRLWVVDICRTPILNALNTSVVGTAVPEAAWKDRLGELSISAVDVAATTPKQGSQ
jgi:mannosyltransferase